MLIFLLLLCLGLSRLLDLAGVSTTQAGMLWIADHRTFFLRNVDLILALTVTALSLGFFINLNKSSLLSVYRARLVRFVLGAATGGMRQPHLFTGFDPSDNLRMSELADRKPLHIINVALNLRGGLSTGTRVNVLASFTITRLHSGS